MDRWRCCYDCYLERLAYGRIIYAPVEAEAPGATNVVEFVPTQLRLFADEQDRRAA